ncbi:MAG TPA: YafY family protein [Thermomicrobiales bacterium]|jgi:predicted DNA-binding transcriptional regulator YafY
MVIPRPTTRLLALLEVLQTRDLVSGAELARRLEVDGRSVRRYIAMLDEIGIPVETVRGPAGGYRLRPGPKIPPLLLTDEEAIALALALQAVPGLGLDLGAGVAAGLRAKLERTLPAGIRARVRALEGSVALDPGPAMMAAEGALVAALGEAAEAGRRVRLRYRAEGDAGTVRLVEPYGVARWSRAWYLVAYCHLRVGVRLFRLDRIAGVETLPERFERPHDFDPYAYVARAMAEFPGRWAVTVALDLPLDRARASVLAPYGTLEVAPAGDETIFRGRFDNLDGVARWLVSVGCGFVVREPAELREALRRLAGTIAATADATCD